ncbi:hypothetical protein [Paraburkholderia sp. GAS348]|jgi:hypothetical protein|uniref:hypothetical protein n=1 Tax=Paraburkholderia sp. GAS348 TaxID=3035132 RepID=UPI003D2170F4
MENPLQIAEPVALARPRGAHRFEAFSPKLTRRMTFYRCALLEQWVLLEADPPVITFCERPGYVQINGDNRLADFWVRYIDRDELVILSDRPCEVEATQPDRTLDVHTLSIRRVGPAELAAARVWIENWQRIGAITPLVGQAPSTLRQTLSRPAPFRRRRQALAGQESRRVVEPRYGCA